MKTQMLIIGLLIGLIIGISIGRYLLKPSKSQIVRAVNDMDVAELGNLIKKLEDNFGVSATAPKAKGIEFSDDKSEINNESDDESR